MILIEETLPRPVDEDRLVQLHVRIAQRADQLAQRRLGPRSRELDLRCWLEAERQILGENPDWRDAEA